MIITMICISCQRDAESDFEKHFIDKTLRINLIHTGDANSETFKLDKIYDDGLWYGRTKNMVNPYCLGAYQYEVRDVETDALLYSDGISNVFSEWRMTDEAHNIKKSFKESIRIPYPRREAKLTMYKIDTLGVTEPVWEYVINRTTRSLIEPAKNHNNRIMRLLDSGDPKEKVDILLLGDGYNASDIRTFDADVEHFYNVFVEFEPFKSRKKDFNVHAILVPTTKEGNSLKTQYGVFGHEKYALVFDEWVFREYAAQSPYDYAIILLNGDMNIGGSLFNLYTTTAIRSQSDDYVIRHETGHQIIGIEDRYYSDDESCDTIGISTYFYDNNDMINKILDLHTR